MEPDQSFGEEEEEEEEEEEVEEVKMSNKRPAASPASKPQVWFIYLQFLSEVCFSLNKTFDLFYRKKWKLK